VTVRRNRWQQRRRLHRPPRSPRSRPTRPAVPRRTC